MATEAALVRAIIARVKQFYPDAYVRKLADRHSRGLPDLLIMCRGQTWTSLGPDGKENVMFVAITLLVEAKAEGSGRLSKIQEVEHERIAHAGGRVIVATSADEVLVALAEMGAVPRWATGGAD